MREALRGSLRAYIMAAEPASRQCGHAGIWVHRAYVSVPVKQCERRARRGHSMPANRQGGMGSALGHASPLRASWLFGRGPASLPHRQPSVTAAHLVKWPA